MKTSALTGSALDWAVARSLGIPAEELRVSWMGIFRLLRDKDGKLNGMYQTGPDLLFSRKWEAAGPIIDREDISVFRLDDENLVDEQGFCTNERRPVWGAVIGAHHSAEQSRNGYGDPCGLVYEMDANCAVEGPTALIAAMRCFVASKLGDTVELPKELT